MIKCKRGEMREVQFKRTIKKDKEKQRGDFFFTDDPILGKNKIKYNVLKRVLIQNHTSLYMCVQINTSNAHLALTVVEEGLGGRKKHGGIVATTPKHSVI